LPERIDPETEPWNTPDNAWATVIDDFAITDAMIRYGGSFVSGLGRLYRQADADNRASLKTAFPAYWKTYHDLALFKAHDAQWGEA
jgi:hypothetical protein